MTSLTTTSIILFLEFILNLVPSTVTEPFFVLTMKGESPFSTWKYPSPIKLTIRDSELKFLLYFKELSALILI